MNPTKSQELNSGVPKWQAVFIPVVTPVVLLINNTNIMWYGKRIEILQIRERHVLHFQWMLVECLFIQLIVPSSGNFILLFLTGNHRTTSHKVTIKHGYSHVIKVGHIFGRFRRLGVRLVGRGILYGGYCKYCLILWKRVYCRYVFILLETFTSIDNDIMTLLLP